MQGTRQDTVRVRVDVVRTVRDRLASMSDPLTHELNEVLVACSPKEDDESKAARQKRERIATRNKLNDAIDDLYVIAKMQRLDNESREDVAKAFELLCRVRDREGF